MKNKKLFGLTNEIYVDEDKKILYKKSHDYCDFFLDRINEMQIYEQLKTMSNNWFIIPYHWSFEKRFCSKTIFYSDAKTLEMVEITKDNIMEIKSLIDKIHSIDLPKIKFFDPLLLLAKFQTKTKAIKELEIYKPQIEIIINRIWNEQTKYVFSHNDIVKGNLIWTQNQWKIIDFEYASYNHYLFDYASFMSESLRPQQWKEFINILNLKSNEIEELIDIINFQNYLWAYWAIYMLKSTKNEIYQYIYLEKLSQLKCNQTLFSFLK